MSIHLGHIQIMVPQQFLDIPKIRSMLKQMNDAAYAPLHTDLHLTSRPKIFYAHFEPSTVQNPGPQITRMLAIMPLYLHPLMT